MFTAKDLVRSLFRPLALACGSLVLVSSAALAAPDGKGKETILTERKALSAEAPDTSAKEATIGNITDLARQVRIAKLQKQLRDLKTPPTAAAKPSTVAAVDTGLRLTDGIPLPREQLRGKATMAVPPVPETPVVSGISGTGAALTATLVGGRRVATGDKLTLGDVNWTAESVTAGMVTFKRCDAKTVGNSTCSTVYSRVSN